MQCESCFYWFHEMFEFDTNVGQSCHSSVADHNSAINVRTAKLQTAVVLLLGMLVRVF